MALIKCPECGKENVSDSAVSCPECGFSIKEHFDKTKLEELRIKEQKEYQEKQAAEERIRRETAPERQKDTITRLEKQIEKSQKELIKGVIGLAISLPLFILFWCLSSHGSLGILIVISGFAVVGSGIFVVGSITEKSTAVRDLEVAKRDFDEYEKESAQKSQAYAAQARIYAVQNAAKHPKCPMCGSTNTEKIGTLNRATSVAAVGLASSKIGKQYECKNCKHKW